MTEKKKLEVHEYTSYKESQNRVKDFSQEQIMILKNFLKEILTPETTNGTWCPNCPEFKQSRTVSSLIQFHLGGDILCCRTRQGSMHYWNLLPNEQEIDLTKEEFKFSGDSPSLHEIDIVEEGRVIFKDTRIEEKYEILKEETQRVLKERGMESLWDLILD